MDGSDSRNQLLERVLPSAEDADSKAIAASVDDALQALSGELSLLVGARGLAALGRRARLLVGQHHAWLLPTAEGSSAHPFANVPERIAAQSKADAALGARALLTVITDLVAMLIGESLTGRLLIRAWARRGTGRDTAEKLAQ